MPDIFDEVAPADIFDQVAGRDLFDEVADGPDEAGLGQEVRGVGRAVQRGALQGLQALDTMRLANVTARPPQFSDERRAFLAGRFAEQEQALYGGRPERLAELAQAAESTPVQIAREISGRQQRIDALPAAPDLANLRTDFWRTLATNPVETIATVVAESLPQAAPGIVGAAAGGGPVAVGANSLGVEYANSLLESAGPEVVRDPEALARWFAVPANQAAAKERALKRGLPVAVFDAASAGLAGRFLNPALGQGRRAVGVATAKELGLQAGAGMAGETAGQLASEGRITSVPDIVLEGIAELGTAPGEVFGNLRNEVGSRVREQMGGATPQSAIRLPQSEDELPDYREPAPEESGLGAGAASPRMEASGPETIAPLAPRFPDIFDTLQGAAESVPAEGFTPIDQAVGQSRLGRMDPAAGVAEAVPAEGWTPFTSFIRREQLRPRTVTPETAAPEPGPTPEQRTASQEFDRLLIEIGPEAGWVDNLDALAPQMETAKQDATTITARLARGAELRKLRFRAAQAFGLDAAKMNLDVRERAQLLPALQAYVEKVIVPQRQADSLTAAIQPEPGKQPVNTGDLAVGDVLTIDGEPVRVDGVDPDTGEVTLQDGTRFGRTTIADGQTIYVETVAPVGSGVQFLAEQDTVPQVAGITLYHGTNKSFGSGELAANRKRAGVYLTTDAQAAAEYGPNVHKYTLPATAKVLDLSDGGDLWGFMLRENLLTETQANDPDLENYTQGGQLFQYDLSNRTRLADSVIQQAKRLGYDVVKLADDLGGRGDNTAYVVTDPKVLKPGDSQTAQAAPDSANTGAQQEAPANSAIRNPQSAILAAPESVAEQRARQEREAAQAQTKADREKLAELQAKPLTGSVGDIGATDMFDPAKNDLFSAPVTKRGKQTLPRFDPIVSGKRVLSITTRSDTPTWQVTVFTDESLDTPAGHEGFKTLPRALSEIEYRGPENREIADLGKQSGSLIYEASKQNPGAQRINPANFIYSSPLRPLTGVRVPDAVAALSFKSKSGGLAGVVEMPRPLTLDEMIRLDLAPINAAATDAYWKAVADKVFPDHQEIVAGKDSSPTDKAIAALEALKVDTAGKVFDAIQGIPVAVWNGALSAAQLALRAGAKVADAISAALAHIRQKHKAKFDEAAVRAELERDLLGEARFETGTALPDFQPYATSQRIFTKAFGAETLPWVGRLFGPRGKRFLSAVDRALVTWAAERYGVGKAVASAIGTEIKGRVDSVWRANEQGDLNVTPRTPGQSLKESDVIEALQVDPDAYRLTPEQRQVFDRIIQPLDKARKALVKRYGLAATEDEDGNLLAYFPRIVTKMPQTPDDTTGGSGQRVGGKQGFQKARAFRTEAQGWAAGYEYETSIERRLVTAIERLYKAMADQRLAANPEVQGRTRSEVLDELAEYHAEELGAGLMTETELGRMADGIMQRGGVNQPAFAGRTFARPRTDGGPGLDLTLKQELDAAFQSSDSRVRDLIMKGNNFVKAVRLGFDLGAPFVQGLPVFFRSPATWAQATAKSMQALFSPEAFPRYLLRESNRQAARELAQLGSPVGSLPEMLAGLGRGEVFEQAADMVRRVPVVGQLAQAGVAVKNAFGRQFQTFMDVAKLELWKAHRGLYPQSQWPELAQSLEALMLSGRMESAGVSRLQSNIERVALLAPSYYRGAVNLAAAAARPGVSGHVARRALLHFAAGASVAFVGIGLSLGMGEDELKRRFNPNDANFMQWRVQLPDGRTVNLGFGGMFRSWVRLLANMVKTSLDTPRDWLALDYQRNPLSRWLRGHMAPVPAFAMDAFSGRDFMGRQTDLTDIGEQVIPLWMASIIPKTGKVPPGKLELAASWTGLNGFAQTPMQYIRTRASEFNRRKLGPQPRFMPEESQYARLEWALRLNNLDAARREHDALVMKLTPAPGKTPQRMILEHFRQQAADGTFAKYRAHEAEFRRSLLPHEQELYRLAREEQRALYPRLRAALRATQ